MHMPTEARTVHHASAQLQQSWLEACVELPQSTRIPHELCTPGMETCLQEGCDRCLQLLGLLAVRIADDRAARRAAGEAQHRVVGAGVAVDCDLRTT